MKASSQTYASLLLACAVSTVACRSLSYQDHPVEVGLSPEPLPGAPAPTFDAYRSPLDARVLDRRFRTKRAMYLANEMHQCGFPFFEKALEEGLIEDDPEFQYMTTVESYWYSRYNMSALVSESRLGVGLVFSPYVTEWALRKGQAGVNRDRGEYVRSNKATLVQDIIPSYLARTGFPRRFEDASPSMLHFASGDPHLVRRLDKGMDFESTENLMRDGELERLYGDAYAPPLSGMGYAGNDMWTHRINYREDFLSLRWDNAKMDHSLDLGAEGQVLMKMVLWAEYFFQGSHHGGRFLGNDPEEGYRGTMLNLMAVSKMLMLKGSMLYDGTRLLGVDPRFAEPGKQYFPHRLDVRLRMVGDLPPRPEELSVADPSSQLFDQASLLWGLSEYYHFADPSIASNWNKVFGEDPPYDGSVMEQKYILLAEGLANMVLDNLQAMHMRGDGLLASEWRPGYGTGHRVSTLDLGMAMIGIANYAKNLHVQPERVEVAKSLLAHQALFLLSSLQESDGAVADGYDFDADSREEGPTTLLAQGIAVRGLLQAWEVLGDERYLDGAKAAYDFMNRELWDEATGLYRSSVDAEVTEYTPMNLGAALGAMREMILTTKNGAEIQRFKRFWVQAVDGSGIQQSEYEETGEKDFYAADGDGDGIPRIEYGDGKFGIASVFASRVTIQTPLH